MTDPWGVPGQQPHQPARPPAYGSSGGYGQPPSGYGQAPAPYGMVPEYGYGPPGRVRPTGTSIALFICTLSVYGYVYNYKVHSEMKGHSGRGVGGGIALLLTFIAAVAMPFVTPAEVGSLYARRGQPEPVRGWTGLWLILPGMVGYFVLFASLLVGGAGFSGTQDSSVSPAFGVGLGLGLFLYVVCALGGAVVWFVKTNGALNHYWESLSN